MTADAKKNVVTKKRKICEDIQKPEPPKKKSPLFNKPQNYYAPPTIASMSNEELAEWRKEQRRKRNRESAAASRNKTRAKIEELEGEVDKWKGMYHQMEAKMRCMERHIQYLLRSAQDAALIAPGPPRAANATPPLQPPPAMVSQPNSPPRSPQSVLIPTAVTSFVPPPPAYAPRVKITGADSSLEDAVEQQQPPVLPTCNSVAKNEEADEEGGRVSSCVAQEGGLNKMTAKNEAEIHDEMDPIAIKDMAHSPQVVVTPESSEDDGDLLDLLVDTLDGEFDPNLLI